MLTMLWKRRFSSSVCRVFLCPFSDMVVMLENSTGMGETVRGLSMFEGELLRVCAHDGPLEFFAARSIFRKRYDVEMDWQRFSGAWDELHERGLVNDHGITQRHMQLTEEGWELLGATTDL